MLDALFALLIGLAALWVPLFALVKFQLVAVASLPKPVMYLFAIIGVPIHELSHALVAFVCGHKVQKVTLFQPDKSGTLGFVEHAYKPGVLSWFTNLLIGLAPMFGGVAAIIGLTYLLFPELSLFAQSSQWDNDNIVGSAYSIISASIANATAYNWEARHWIWLYLSVSTAMFLVPSRPDFEGALPGILITISALLVLTVLASGAMNVFFGVVSSLVLKLYPVLLLSILVYGLLLVLGFLINVRRQ